MQTAGSPQQPADMASTDRFSGDFSLDVVGIGSHRRRSGADRRQLPEQPRLNKGGMALIDEQQAETRDGPGQETSGGSAANTLVGIAELVVAPASSAKRDDQLGRIFSHDIQAVDSFDPPQPRAPARFAARST